MADIKLMFIINPVAGRKTIMRSLADVLLLFSDYGWATTVYMTKSPGDGTSLVIEHGKDYALIVCAGGDGTLNEVVTGIAKSAVAVPLGYIPCGSTNVFADSHALPKNIMQAARRIMENQVEYCDIGAFNGRHFSCIAAFGAFCDVSYTTPQDAKNILGKVAYLFGTIKNLSQVRRKNHMVIEHGGEIIEDDFVFGAVNNSASIACLLDLSKNGIRYDDGLFEVLLIRSLRSPAELQGLVTALKTQQYEMSDRIVFFKSDKLVIKNTDNAIWTVDGEMAHAGERVIITNELRVLQVIC